MRLFFANGAPHAIADMDRLDTPAAMRDWRDNSRTGGKIVLVPTMGALHEGHLRLLDRAREVAGDGGKVVATIFLNPLQFDRAEDLATYPQTLEADLKGCADRGADAVFVPQVDDLYAPDRSVLVTESRLSQRLCGETRPGHFDGVCTVVLKLFLLSGATDAVFGEKDFQQLAIVRRMVRDLDVPVAIHGVDTVRSADGLALSSRNARLTAAAREQAPVIRRALLAARSSDKTSAAGVVETARRMIEECPLARIDYLELVDRESLAIAHDLSAPTTLATAVFFGDVRLIDHISIAPR